MRVVPAEGVVLDRVLESAYPIWGGGLTRRAYRTFDTAQMKTAWASRHRRRHALVEGRELLASATTDDLAVGLDGGVVRACGIGAVLTDPAHRGSGHARTLIERLLDDAARSGTAVALLSSSTDERDDVPPGFAVVPTTDVELVVEESPRHGAPMTMVRCGEERDLAAVVAMGQVRASPFRFHIDRDVDFVRYAITKQRLLAGLGSAGGRQLHFFIAEEGLTAAAYVVISVVGRAWTIEECGDRDPSGARVGAILQALIAREPAERRPSIRGWLPPGFRPPQVTIVAETPSTEVMRARFLGSTTMPPLSAGDVLYWHSDVL
jgi:GNAT superfamily N-acetyltransferase